MAKITKTRISATIPPRQREYLDRLAVEDEISFAEAVTLLIDEAIESRRVIAEALGLGERQRASVDSVIS